MLDEEIDKAIASKDLDWHRKATDAADKRWKVRLSQ
jgi:hypothetical protein